MEIVESHFGQVEKGNVLHNASAKYQFATPKHCAGVLCAPISTAAAPAPAATATNSSTTKDYPNRAHYSSSNAAERSVGTNVVHCFVAAKWTASIVRFFR